MAYRRRQDYRKPDEGTRAVHLPPPGDNVDPKLKALLQSLQLYVDRTGWVAEEHDPKLKTKVVGKIGADPRRHG